MEKRSSLLLRIIQYVMVGMAIFGLTSALVHLVRPKDVKEPGQDGGSYLDVYTITYLASADKQISVVENELPIVPFNDSGRKVFEIDESLFKENGAYPTEYVYGKVLKIDDLQTKVTVNFDFHYIFGGWYLDSACTEKFAGITEDTVGNITLYAKLTLTSSWTGFY